MSAKETMNCCSFRPDSRGLHLRYPRYGEDPDTGSALDHIELTYHDVTVFAIPEFESLEVLEKKYFCINIIVNQP